MQIRNTNDPGRGGMATLEFCMALPFLALLMVGITWLGFSVIGQTEVLVEARNAAWKQRFENRSNKPLVFPLEVNIPGMPTYSRGGDFVTETASKEVDISPIFGMMPDPEARHTVIAGSWDWRAMPLNDPPNYELLGIAAVNGTAGKFQNLLSQLNGEVLLETLEKIAEDALKDAIKEATKDSPELEAILKGIESFDGTDWQGVVEEVVQGILENAARENKAVEAILEAAGLLDENGSKESKLGDEGNTQNAANAEQQKRDAAHAAELQAVISEITATQAEITRLEGELNPPEDAPPPPEGTEEQQEAEQEAKEGELEFYQNKLERLNSQKADIERGPDLDGAYE